MSLDQLLSIARTFILGPFLVLAFLAGTFIFWKKGGEEYYDQAELMDVLILSCFIALIGSRLGFILVHITDFGLDIVKWFSWLSYPGYLGIAGLLCGYAAMLWQAKKRKWDAYEVGDFGAIALSLGLVFVFLGEFLNGSGFGNPTSLPIGMYFPGVFDARHPTQLYAMVLYLILFILLWKLERVYRTFIWYRANRRTAQSGFVMSSFLIGYGVIGLLLSLVQPSFLTMFGVNIDVLIRLFVIVWGIVLLYMRSGRGVANKKKLPLRPGENSTILPEDVTHTARDTSETQTTPPRTEGQAEGLQAGS